MKLRSIKFLFVFMLFFFSSVNAMQIDQKVIETPITDGAVRLNYKIFDNDGWLDINVIKVDIQNPNIDLDVLTDQERITKRQTVSNLVKQNNAVAGINADFFNMKDLTHPLGPLVRDGQLETIHSQMNLYSKNMAAFSLTKENIPSIDYYTANGAIYTEDGKASDKIVWYNRVEADFGNLGYLDTKAMKDTSLIDKKYPNLVKLVVEDGVVKEIVEKKTGTIIPKNGYIIIGTGDLKKSFLMNKFKVGDRPKLSMNVNPSIENKKFVVGGAAILIQNGAIPEKFSFDVPGVNPRSAIGFSEDKKYIYLVTVDGRNTHSRGMTQWQFANFMKTIGIYNALNLDGGGSTAMATKNIFTSNVELTNIPSDGAERKVINSIGVRTKLKGDVVGNIIVKSHQKYGYLGKEFPLKVYAYDMYMNPISITESNLKFEVEGVEGGFAGKTFYPKSKGTATIKVDYNGISGSMKVDILDSADLLVKNEKVEKSTTGFKIGIFGNTNEPKTLLDQIIIRNAYEKINEKGNVAIFTNKKPIPFTFGIPVVETKNQYTTTELQDFTYIELLINEKGMRTADKNQWNTLNNKLKTLQTQNLMIYLSKPMYSWGDQLEANLLKDKLEELSRQGKNIFVLTDQETVSKVELKDGVRYISLNGIQSKEKWNIYDSYKVMWIVIKDGNVYYNLEQVVDKN